MILTGISSKLLGYVVLTASLANSASVTLTTDGIGSCVLGNSVAVMHSADGTNWYNAKVGVAGDAHTFGHKANRTRVYNGSGGALANHVVGGVYAS